MTENTSTSSQQRENPFISFGFNLLLPILLLSKGSKWLPSLSPEIILIIALACPVGYFCYDFQKRRSYNFISILGMISVILTGGIGLLKLSPFVFAIKETVFPLFIGVAVVASLKTKYPLLKTFLYNPSIMDTERVDNALDTEEKRSAFNQLMVQCTWILASSFLLSAILNFIITRMIVTTDPNLDQNAFNEEVGKQTGITWIVITITTMPLMVAAMWKLFGGIKKLTGLGLEDIMHDPKAAESK